MTSKGMTSKGMTSKGMTSKGMTSKGMTSKGMTSKGMTSKGMTSESVADIEDCFSWLLFCFQSSSVGFGFNGSQGSFVVLHSRVFANLMPRFVQGTRVTS